MVNKKYLLLAGFCSLLAVQPAFAQESQSNTQATEGAQWSARDMTYRGQSYDVLDSNYIPKHRMEQQRKFLNHQYAYPAKPRNMWEVGVGTGLFNVIGDIPTLMLWEKGGYGFHAQVRKSWGYLFSTRLQYIYGVAKGLDWQPTTGYGATIPYDMYYPTVGGATPNVFRSYRTEAHQLNLDFMLSTNNIKFHKAQTGVSFYGYGGIGVFAYKTRFNALDPNYIPYNFGNMVTATSDWYSHRKDTRKQLQSGMDKTYESAAPGSDPTIFDGKTLDFVPSVGVGAQFRISKRVNIQLEDRYSFPSDDMVDGTQFGGAVNGMPARSTSKDGINYASVGINFNLGNAKKNVEPLYWLNPLDFSYNELSYPRHMILPEPVLPDADADGITDQFDKCPGTPAGVAVDSHGCPMDTDGDGVPDFRDKQLITPTECQPVDADGVGKCPCPEGCGSASACGNIGAGSIIFSNNSTRITSAMQAQLATLAAQMQANPTCKVVITGAGNGSKLQQQRSWDRVNAIIQYMSEKNGISRDRFIFQYGQAGDENTVMYRSAMTGEEGPANVAPPFPNLRRD